MMAVMLIANIQADATARSHAARAEFQRQHPCPANGAQRGPCHGYVVDHVIPLCAGGGDTPANMQWQPVEESRIKDQEERRQCSLLRKETRVDRHQ